MEPNLSSGNASRGEKASLPSMLYKVRLILIASGMPFLTAGTHLLSLTRDFLPLELMTHHPVLEVTLCCSCFSEGRLLSSEEEKS